MSEPCCKRVHDAYSFRGRPCGRKAKQAPDGNWYCAVHNPEAIAKRREKSNAKIDAWVKERRENSKAQQENARRLALFDDLVSMLQTMLDKDQKNTCRHEETHRGGIIWTICDQCGRQWADDEGGKPDFEEPKEWAEAENLLQKARAIK